MCLRNGVNSLNILVTIPKGPVREAFFKPDMVKLLESMGCVRWNESECQLSPDELRGMLKGMDTCITGWGTKQYDSHVLEGADRLRLIAHTGGSVGTLVGHEVYDRGIKVISGNWLYAESVAEGTLAYMLCALRRIPYYMNEVQQGRWSQANSLYEGLLEQNVGLVGFGMVAKYLVKMLMPFRVGIKVYDPFAASEVLKEYQVEKAALEEIFSTCKVISIHAPRTPDTYHMIDSGLLKRIPDGALLVNTARGSIIDQTALEEELGKGRINAVLDVFEEEPLPMDSKLRGLENVLLIPHMGGPTYDRRSKVTFALLQEIRNFFDGKPYHYDISREYALAMTR